MVSHLCKSIACIELNITAGELDVIDRCGNLRGIDIVTCHTGTLCESLCRKAVNFTLTLYITRSKAMNRFSSIRHL